MSSRLNKWAEALLWDGAAVSRSEKLTRAIPEHFFVILFVDSHDIRIIPRSSSGSCFQKEIADSGGPPFSSDFSLYSDASRPGGDGGGDPATLRRRANDS